jgi:hypothetical protein
MLTNVDTLQPIERQLITEVFYPIFCIEKKKTTPENGFLTAFNFCRYVNNTEARTTKTVQQNPKNIPICKNGSH